jgi:single-stranded DNA-specific DHH superfamily exonuclease
MEQALYILFGAGAIIMTAALFMKKQAGSTLPEQNSSLQRQWERAEVEKSLERFVQQIKQENEAVTIGMQRTKADLQQEVARLRHRLDQVETELAKLAAHVQALGEHNNLRPREQEAQVDDILSLRERYRRAFEWRQQGLDLDEIAKRLGAGRGELELIFSLAAPQERGEGHG